MHVAVIQCTHHTSFPHLTGWFSSCHREGRWRGPLGNFAQYPGSTRPRRPLPSSCLRFPRPAHLLGYRWHSTRWTQWWRLPLGPTPSPTIKGLEDTKGNEMILLKMGSAIIKIIITQFFSTSVTIQIKSVMGVIFSNWCMLTTFQSSPNLSVTTKHTLRGCL